MNAGIVGRPLWHHGEPANLAAAISDADKWLDLLVSREDWLGHTNRERCRRALDALRKQAGTE